MLVRGAEGHETGFLEPADDERARLGPAGGVYPAALHLVGRERLEIREQLVAVDGRTATSGLRRANRDRGGAEDSATQDPNDASHVCVRRG